MKESMKFNSQVGTSDEQSQRLLDIINKIANKFKLLTERDAFMEGVRSGFQLASERYIEYLSEFEKRRTNNIIVIENNEKQ